MKTFNYVGIFDLIFLIIQLDDFVRYYQNYHKYRRKGGVMDRRKEMRRNKS